MIASDVPRAAQTPAGIETNRSPASTEPTAGPPATTAKPTTGPGVDLPTSAPLAMQQFIVPRGKDAATQLSLATVAGVGGPRTLSTVAGRNSWPMLVKRSADDHLHQLRRGHPAHDGGRRQRRSAADRIVAQGMREHHSGFLESQQTNRS